MRTITECRACQSKDLINVLDLGEQYLSDFRVDKIKPPKYPLDVVLCKDCKLVQLRHTTPSKEMYHERYGFKSGVNNTIKADLKDIVDHALKYKPNPLAWLDIASNDGTLLSYVPKNVFRAGADPIKKLCVEAEQHANRIVNGFFRSCDFKEKFDVVTSISCFYDMDDPSTFVKEVCDVLADDGVWIVQQNYLLTTIQLNAVDNICHEHLEYYSLMAMENLLDKFGLEVNEVSTSMINGGSFRTVISRKDTFSVDKSVEKQRYQEELARLDDPETYRYFGQVVQEQLQELARLIHDIRKYGSEVYIYGASTRGGTIWQGAGLDVNDLPYAVERNPDKVGRFIASIGVPIISEETARKLHPEYMLVSPWFFRDEFIEREQDYLQSGGKFIFPLPTVEIVGA